MLVNAAAYTVDALVSAFEYAQIVFRELDTVTAAFTFAFKIGESVFNLFAAVGSVLGATFFGVAQVFLKIAEYIYGFDAEASEQIKKWGQGAKELQESYDNFGNSQLANMGKNLAQSIGLDESGAKRYGDTLGSRLKDRWEEIRAAGIGLSSQAQAQQAAQVQATNENTAAQKVAAEAVKSSIAISRSPDAVSLDSKEGLKRLADAANGYRNRSIEQQQLNWLKVIGGNTKKRPGQPSEGSELNA